MARIEWDFPAPRKGFLKNWDTLIGPGATRAENSLVIGASLLGLLGMAARIFIGQLDFSLLQVIVALLIATDLAGGVPGNLVSTAKRWYHHEDRTMRDQLIFTAAHVYPLVIAWLFRGGNWFYGIAIYGVMVLFVLIILQLPLYLRRPASGILYLVAVLLEHYAFTPTPGFEWFAAVYFMKLVVGHIVREEPYRPD